MCICLHCVTSDNGNETSTTAFPIFNGATQEIAHALIENASSPLKTTTTTKSTKIPSEDDLTTIPTVTTTSLPDNIISKSKSNSTILSLVPVTSTTNNTSDVTQSPNAEKQEKDIDTTTTVIIKQTDLSTKGTTTTTPIEQTSSTTSTTLATTNALPLSDKTTSTTQVSVTEEIQTIATSTTKPITTTTKSAAPTGDLCLKSHIIKLLPDPTLTGENGESANQFTVNVTKGDITITVISKRLTSAQFIVNRINDLKLIRDSVTLGKFLYEQFLVLSMIRIVITRYNRF